jgi:hypothetical protein
MSEFSELEGWPAPRETLVHYTRLRHAPHCALVPRAKPVPKTLEPEDGPYVLWGAPSFVPLANLEESGPLRAPSDLSPIPMHALRHRTRSRWATAFS